jgi:apolipoprotein N-acyltransferase
MKKLREAFSLQSAGRFLNDRPLLKSSLLGTVTVLSFSPFNIFPIFIATFAWLFTEIFGIKKKESKNIHKKKAIKFLLKESFCFFLFLHMGCLYWLVYPLVLAKYWILIPFAIILIPAYLSMFLLIPTALLAISHYFNYGNYNLTPSCRQKVKVIALLIKPIMFASAFILIMEFYGHVCPGFPWILPGYIWCCHEIFLQTLSIYGIYGLSFVTILISGFLGSAFLYYQKNGSNNLNDLNKLNDSKKFTMSSTIIAGALFIFIVLFGYFRLANHPTEFTEKKIKIVQCNIPQENKGNPDLAFSQLK